MAADSHDCWSCVRISPRGTRGWLAVLLLIAFYEVAVHSNLLLVAFFCCQGFSTMIKMMMRLLLLVEL